jgi:hypothetical protein
MGKIAADLPAKANPRVLVSNFGWLVAIVFAVFVSIDHDRFRSWARDVSGLPLGTKRLLVGIIIPDAVGLLLFALLSG